MTLEDGPRLGAPSRPAAWPALVLAVVVLLVLSACGGDGDGQGDGDAASPPLGAASPPRLTPPAEALDDVEKPVMDRLAPRVRKDGLHLEHVDCPGWGGHLPARLRCRAWVDGVLGSVQVRLHRGTDERVEFDAWFHDGVVATSRLVRKLTDEGYDRVDCGPVRAYPARVGMRIVCRVQSDGESGHVVATVTDRSGVVRVQDY